MTQFCVHEVMEIMDHMSGNDVCIIIANHVKIVIGNFDTSQPNTTLGSGSASTATPSVGTPGDKANNKNDEIADGVFCGIYKVLLILNCSKVLGVFVVELLLGVIVIFEPLTFKIVQTKPYEHVIVSPLPSSD